jgi:hypothetical protein
MPVKPVDTAPVEQVGGTKETGPWPEEVAEIARDDRLRRPLPNGNGEVEEREVIVKNIQQIVDSQGIETDGYAVAMQYTP